MMSFYLLKFDFFETRKPENPKVDFNFEPEPDQTRNLFSNWNPKKPDPKSHARPQPEPEEFWTRPITSKKHKSISENHDVKIWYQNNNVEDALLYFL